LQSQNEDGSTHMKKNAKGGVAVPFLIIELAEGNDKVDKACVAATPLAAVLEIPYPPSLGFHISVAPLCAVLDLHTTKTSLALKRLPCTEGLRIPKQTLPAHPATFTAYTDI